ncbi:helix-turn-helix transcriptional regulator [Streptomyces sp. NPDC047014]|uniref:helix-turn-helix transcriptional regulator n=1 Tax=Streptomyces sp. NPDC047014 TaxID=3155736 RepID=UPI00340CEA56
METLRFDSSDLEATEAFMSRAYTPMRIGGRPRDIRARVVRSAAERITVDKLALDFTMAYDAGALDRVTLLTLHTGALADTTAGRDEVYGAGESFLITQPGRPYAGEVRAARYTVAMFDTALLDEVAATGARTTRPVALTGNRAIDPAANRRLGATVAYLRDHVLSDPDAGPLAVSTAVRHLAAVTLECLPNSTTDEQLDPLDSRDASTATLRRAIAFIEDNAHRDIGITDIAAAAYVTPRAAQYAFSRHTGTTPLGFLRKIRLERAHAELKLSDPTTTTVTAIAMKWSFAHPGRFAAAYRATYGVSPSTTLHRTGP